MGMMLGVFNRCDSATLSSGSWNASLPLVNLQSRQLGRVARSSDATNTSTKFIADLISTERLIRIVSLVNHNLSLTSQYRIRASSDSGFSTILYDSGVTSVYPAIHPLSTLEWEQINFWDGTPGAEDIKGYTTNLCVILPQLVVARYWKVELFDTTNTDGFVEIGRFFIGSGYTPTVNMAIGADIGWQTPTAVTTTISGAKYFQKRTPYRVANLTLPVLSVDEAMANLFEIDRRSGIDQEVIYIFDTADTYHALRRRYLGTIKTLSPVQYPYGNALTKTYSIEEVL